MVYVRAKTVKGDKYLYLVKSIWDSKKSSSRQEIIKYLGKASDVTLDDVPIDYRNDPKINAYLSSYAVKDPKELEKITNQVRKDLFKALTNADLDKSFDIFQTYVKESTLPNFYEKILKPVLYEIGDLWAKNKLSVATEHVASNIVKELISLINDKTAKLDHKPKVLLCTPSGEEHAIGCNVIQSFLQSKGYRVFNLAPSAPAESILHFIEGKKPDIVFVSITLEDNIKPGQRLVSKITGEFSGPVMVGGQALNEKEYKFNAEILQNAELDKIPKIIKNALA